MFSVFRGQSESKLNPAFLQETTPLLGTLAEDSSKPSYESNHFSQLLLPEHESLSGRQSFSKTATMLALLPHTVVEA